MIDTDYQKNSNKNPTIVLIYKHNCLFLTRSNNQAIIKHRGTVDLEKVL
jgi:hypothetical protein